MGMNEDTETPTADFKVEWEIDASDSEGPVDAARYAQSMMQMDREGYEANVFTARDSEGKRFRVDLAADIPEPERI